MNQNNKKKIKMLILCSQKNKTQMKHFICVFVYIFIKNKTINLFSHTFFLDLYT